jgi:site-specific recombinase XerC
LQTALRSLNSDSNIGINDLRRFIKGWILDGEYRQLSPRTLELRRHFLNKLVWWLENEGFESCGTFEIRAFIGYVSNGHLSEQGRWGNPALKTAVKSRTVKDVHAALRTFFRFLVSEGYIPVSPMEGLRPQFIGPTRFSRSPKNRFMPCSRHQREVSNLEGMKLYYSSCWILGFE